MKLEIKIKVIVYWVHTGPAWPFLLIVPSPPFPGQHIAITCLTEWYFIQWV